MKQNRSSLIFAIGQKRTLAKGSFEEVQTYTKEQSDLIRALVIGLSLIVLAACTSVDKGNSDVFYNPEAYLGQKVKVCGLQIDTNLVVDYDENGTEPLTGLVLNGNQSASDRKASYKKRCAEGVINYMGCETNADLICTGAAFDYAISIE